MDNKKRTTWILIICNAFWLLWLMYWSYLFISGSPVVDNPDAMLPLERWDRGGWMLTIGHTAYYCEFFRLCLYSIGNQEKQTASFYTIYRMRWFSGLLLV